MKANILLFLVQSLCFTLRKEIPRFYNRIIKMKWRNTVFLIIQKIWGTYEPGRVKFHRRVYPGERGRKCGRSRMNKIQEWKIKRRRVTHMTVAHTCKRGAPAFTRKGTTYSLKAPRPTAIRGRVHHPLEKFFFFFNSSLPLPESVCLLHSPPRLAIVVVRSSPR